ncbi:MAG TPA: DNA primase [Actinomycetota bacterium]|nr:DNA primase [Actinomycetota bacterium]
MARIRQEDIEAVRERTDLVRLVQQYLALKKAGRSFSGLCPFHTEKTPSFSVDPAKQVYYCFGCGAGGNAFHFLEQVENVTFPEAVERLARQAGVTLRYEGVSPGERRPASRRQALHRALDRAADLYRRMLLEGREAEQARRYLAGRDISREAVERFGVGYAPGYPDFLLRRMAREFSPEILLEAGLALKDARGQVRDRFRSRVMFPVHDLSGQAVGFGARLLEGDGPKYLNSPETPVYRKGHLLYNLHRAKGEVARGGRAFVVEGYTDVIALDAIGIPTAVATCGTAVGEGHFELLRRFAERVILAFDSDEAGARAAQRAYGFHERFPVETLVLVLPEGLDPADFARERGREAFEELAGRAVPLVEYMLRRELDGRDLASPEGQARAVDEALPIVGGLEDPVRRSEYAGLLADLAGVSPSAVLLKLERQPAGPRPGVPAGPAPARREARTPSREVEKEALKLLAQHADLIEGHLDGLEDDQFTTERYRKALALLRSPAPTAAELADRAREVGLAELVAELSLEPLLGEPTREYADRVFFRLQELWLKRRIDTMRKRLERLNPVKDADTFDPLFKELADLTSKWREVRARAGEGA